MATAFTSRWFDSRILYSDSLELTIIVSWTSGLDDGHDSVVNDLINCFQERMDQIMEEARLCQEKLEELKMAAVQVSTTIILMIMVCGGT